MRRVQDFKRWVSELALIWWLLLVTVTMAMIATAVGHYTHWAIGVALVSFYVVLLFAFLYLSAQSLPRHLVDLCSSPKRPA